MVSCNWIFGRVLWLLCVWAGVTCGSCWADGKVFREAVAVPVRTPDQRALLHFSNGVERLVIETSVVGGGTNFAWVVPFPAEPKVEAVSTNFFRYLERAFQPKVVYRASSIWMWLLVFGLLCSWWIWIYRRGSSLVLTMGLLITALLLIGVLAVPSFVRSRGSLATASVGGDSLAVEVIGRETVGVYDTVILKGGEDGGARVGGAVVQWLNGHGFHTPTNALPVITSYAAQGWVFAAVRLNRSDTNAGEMRPHPLAFTFKTERPVYPLRLTGIENGNCVIELFVFGSERAEAESFEVEFCGQPTEYGDGDQEELRYVRSWPGTYMIGAREVKQFALPAAVATKLTAQLRAEEMRDDVWIGWTKYEEALPTVYSLKAAVTRALDWLVGVAVVGAVLVQIGGRRLGMRRRNLGLAIGAGVSVICGVVRFASANVGDVRLSAQSAIGMGVDLRIFEGAVEQFAIERKSPKRLTFEELKSGVTNYMKGGVLNVYSRKPLRHEATPGNVTLEPGTNGVDVVWYDIYGAGHSLGRFLGDQ